MLAQQLLGRGDVADGVDRLVVVVVPGAVASQSALRGDMAWHACR